MPRMPWTFLGVVRETSPPGEDKFAPGLSQGIPLAQAGL